MGTTVLYFILTYPVLLVFAVYATIAGFFIGRRTWGGWIKGLALGFALGICPTVLAYVLLSFVDFNP